MPRRPRGIVDVYLYSFFNLGARGVGVQRHAPAALPPEKTRYTLYRGLGGAQSLRRIILFQTISQTVMASFQLLAPL